jgi:hypothetical protein
VRSLDDFLPAYEFRERHRVNVEAPRRRIDEAVRTVTVAEMPVARALFRLRGIRQRGEGPLVDDLRRAAVVLEDEEGEGLILGLVGRFWRLRPDGVRHVATPDEFVSFGRPDVAKAVLDLRIEPGGVSTETRVHVADRAARRKFARYWLVVRPFSGLIRIVLLRAAKRRAESA